MKMRTTFLTALGAIVALSGCKNDPPVAPVYNTDHPDHGKVVFTAVWPGQAPDSYTVILGEDKATLSGSEAEFPELLTEGDYDYLAYNEPQGVTFAGQQASVKIENGYAASPGWLWSDSGSVAVEKDTDHTVPLDMEPLVRQLNISIEFEGVGANEVEILAARLSGAAQTIDLKTGAVSGTASIAPAFSVQGGLHVATHNLLGVTGQTPMLEIDIELASGETATLKSELDEALAGFNSNKTKALDIELTASNLTLTQATLEVVGWQEGEIRGGSREDPILGTQIALSWPGMDDKIEVIEILDSRGMLYTSPIENGETIGLYNLPDEIYGLTVIYDNQRHEVTLNVRSYDNQTGELTMTDDYNITKPFHFGLITDMAGTYYVRNDIDCTGVTVEQVGSYTSEQVNEPFTGVIDGGGFKILNLNLGTGSNNGLVAMNAGTIKDLEIAKLETGFMGDQRTVRLMGGFCAVNTGTIENCVNRANIQGNIQIGGIAGINRGTITGCENHGEILGISQAGGIVGTNVKDATITDCDNIGNMMGQTKTGGIAGENFGTISSVTSSGALQSYGGYAGGIVGINDGGSIENATNSGGIRGQQANVGGISGASSGTGNSIVSCTNTGTVAGAASSGGIVGNAGNTTIAGCENTGAITGAQPTGGIAGTGFRTQIMWCENRGTVNSSVSQVGGIVGNATTSSFIESCINHAAVTSTGNNVGGIAGMTGTGTNMTACTIQNCWNKGPVSAGNQYVGGIVANSTGTIIACKNSGNVSLANDFGPWSGGIAAITAASHTLTACYNTGDIKGWSNKGGIVGQVSAGMASRITATYNIGELLLLDEGEMSNATPLQSRNGGVVGWNSTSGQIHDSYWDFEAANWTHEPMGIGDPGGNTTPITVSRFTYEAVDPVWPTEEMTGWKVASGANGFGEGHYWSSLGDATTKTYPTLWWEPSEEELLIGKDAMPEN
jgi:hypothetical protein